MKDIIISVSKETRMVSCLKSFIGNDGENLQGNIVFKFLDDFVDGVARLEYDIDDNKHYAMLTKGEDSYSVPIKSVLTKEGQINMQLVITEGEEESGIPIFKSNVFYVYCSKSINAEIEQPDEYPQWIEIANQKLIEVENAIEEVKQFEAEVGALEDDVREIRYEVNNLNLEAEKLTEGVNILAQTVGENTDDINVLEHTTSRLESEIQEQEENINYLEDIKANKTDIPDVSKFVKKTTSDLVNYYTKNETYTQQEVNQLVGAIKSVSMKLVPFRPQTGETNIIYLVPSASATTDNVYDEYIYVSDRWEKIGNTSIDVSNFATKDELNAKQNTLTKTDKDNIVINGLVNNENQLSDEQQIKIEAWLGLANNYLTYYNTTPYQVTNNYTPAHKKYVDDAIKTAITNELESDF